MTEVLVPAETDEEKENKQLKARVEQLEGHLKKVQKILNIKETADVEKVAMVTKPDRTFAQGA